MPTKVNTKQKQQRRSGAFDFDDRIAVRAWIDDVSRRVEDLAAVADDAIRPLARRKLGRLEHRRLYREARRSLASLLAFAGGGVAG